MPRRSERMLQAIVVVMAGLTSAAAALAPAAVSACLWTYATDLDGERIRVNAPHPADDSVFQALRERPSREWLQEIVEQRRKEAQSGDFQARNDFAVALIRAGDVDEAVEILAELAAAHADEYTIAANLGTAYELQGNLKQALQWIRKGIDLNPDAHFGTEWLHVKILEAKQQIAADPTWLESHSIIGWDFGNQLTPQPPTAARADNRAQAQDRAAVRRAIEYQLHERLKLVEPPEPIVADLLESLGNLYAIDMAVEYAVPIYELALEYQPARAGLIRQRLAHFQRLVAANPDSLRPDHSDFWWTVAFICAASSMFVVAVTTVAIVWIRITRRKPTRPERAGEELA